MKWKFWEKDTSPIVHWIDIEPAESGASILAICRCGWNWRDETFDGADKRAYAHQKEFSTGPNHPPGMYKAAMRAEMAKKGKS